jgi:hypothetical protein
MNRRTVALLLAMLAVALPSFARVLSYAPYSDRPSASGYHERTSRRFVLIETQDDPDWYDRDELVLYDTKGEEPRVVFPKDGNPSAILAAALYERKGAGTPIDAPPMLLVVVAEYGGVNSTYFSPDGGETWKNVAGPGYLREWYDEVNDFGGPWTRGLANPIRLGNDQMPFLINFSSPQAVVGIASNGESKTLAKDGFVGVIGQNRAGTKFLLGSPYQVELLDLTGPVPSRQYVARSHESVHYSGWITSDDSIYLQLTSFGNRFLFFKPKGEGTRFILGPYDTTPAPYDTFWPPTGSGDPMRFFAVPTADFEGAWLIQRQSGRPTTMWRHGRNTGLQQMWSDVSGPQVEALIPGNSGQTVLVQVHRDHSVQLQRPFIDPALAVWRVGEPMPREYDELYLNEEWNKGFVHVDVDRLQAGEPFVFNSGSFEDPFGGNEGPVSPPVGGGGDITQEWGVVRGSLRQHLVLPGVARLNGAFNSLWLTDVTIFNPLDVSQDVLVRFVALGEELQGAALREKTVTLEPREIRFIPDALHALFAIEGGGGALHFVPTSGINVTGRTYSRQKDGGGTFGFGMQAIDYFNVASPRFPVTFAGAFHGSNFRTNILLTDTSGVGIEAGMNAYGVSGSIGATSKTIHAPAGGILQFNSLGSTLGMLSHDVGGLTIRPTRGRGIATVVSIDNRTNDPTYFPPDLPATNLVRAIPVIGHVNGANGSRFRSDLYLFNPTDETRTVVLEATQWDGATTRNASFTLLPREARAIPDALSTLFHMSGVARLRYWSQNVGDGVRVTSRTYTIDDTGATYGSLIPPLNNFQIAAPGDRLEILGISGGSGFRTNIGLVELSPTTGAPAVKTRVRVSVLNERLTPLDTFEVEIGRAGGMQINDVFSARGITPPTAAMVIVEVLNGGVLGAYATLTDNITNDTTYLGAQLGARPN